jgi:hypothetical protein
MATWIMASETARRCIRQLLLQPMTSLLVDAVEGDALRSRCRRIEGDRAGHQGQLR